VGTWANHDTLGAGALLAMLRHRQSPLVAPEGRAIPVMGLAAAVILVLAIWSADTPRNVFEPTAQAAVFVWLILQASVGFGGLVGAGLRWKPMAFVGKISYGIYIYHLFVPGLLAFLFLGRAGGALESGWAAAAAAVVATLALSALSWVLLEKPINGLKERFR
jgi:peptidoglycan/LPS O-acetylase OafA/YrhL